MQASFSRRYLARAARRVRRRRPARHRRRADRGRARRFAGRAFHRRGARAPEAAGPRRRPARAGAAHPTAPRGRARRRGKRLVGDRHDAAGRALPFLFIDEPWRALRVSNVLLLLLLFAVGSEWGRYSYANRWLCGLAFLAIGLALVGTAIALGG